MKKLKMRQTTKMFGKDKIRGRFVRTNQDVNKTSIVEDGTSNKGKQKRRRNRRPVKTKEFENSDNTNVSKDTSITQKKYRNSSEDVTRGRFVRLNPDIIANESSHGGNVIKKRVRKRKRHNINESEKSDIDSVPSKKPKIEKSVDKSEANKHGYKPEVLSKLFSKTEESGVASSQSVRPPVDSPWKKQKKRKGINSLADIRKNAELLSSRMQETLAAAKFRYINQQMYTTTSQEALETFERDPQAFKVYHSGYQQQLAKWPIQPIDIIIKQLNNKPKKWVVADMGCGDPRLARSVSQTVHSFDLVPLDDSVTQCDMSQVPLEDGSVDVVVFCLSLMGTNLTDFIIEAHRILKQGGVMKVAEVESRFERIGSFIRNIELLGFTKIAKDESNKMFIMFDFKKTGSVKRKKVRITLAPCMYKKR